jgi:inner membrane protein
MSNFINTPLFWFLLGILFMVIELSHFGFVFFFFGIGAIITALLSLTGISHSIEVNTIIFLVISLLSLALLRRKMSNVFKGKISSKADAGKATGEIIGEKALSTVKIVPNSINGRVEFHGTIWNAQSDEVIEKGKVVEITGRTNLTLTVKAVE